MASSTPFKLVRIYLLSFANLVSKLGDRVTIAKTSKPQVLLKKYLMNFPDSPQSPDIGQNSEGCNSDFRISGQSFIKENCHNSRSIDDIDMEFGLVTKLTRETNQREKNLAMMSCRQIVTLLSFFQFIANLKQS